MKPACSSGALTDVLPRLNAMPQTRHPTPSQYRDTGPSTDVVRHTGIHNCSFQYLGSDPTDKYFPDLSHMKRMLKSNAVMEAFSEKLGRKCTVKCGPQTCDMWLENPLHYRLCHTCFWMDVRMLISYSIKEWVTCRPLHIGFGKAQVNAFSSWTTSIITVMHSWSGQINLLTMILKIL